MVSVPAHPRRIDLARENVRRPLVQSHATLPPSSNQDEMREIIQTFSTRRGLAGCQRGPLVYSASGAKYRRACRNKFGCPTCSPYLLELDRQRIASALHREVGVGYVTFSIAHAADAPPARSFDALLTTWGKAFSTGSWMGDYRARTGMTGWARSVEFTFNEAGAHPHVHAVHTFGRQPSIHDLDELRLRWASSASAIGHATNARVQDVQRIPAGEARERVAFYLTEQSAIRQSRPGKGRTPGDLLHSVATTGDADDLAMLGAFHDATAGRRKVATSRGFFDL